MKYKIILKTGKISWRIKIRSVNGGSFLVQETLKIEGMACNHCVLRVGRAIASVQGVKEVDVNLEKREAVVDFEETRTNLEKIKAAVREAGYEPL